MENEIVKKEHSLTLINRKNLKVTGVLSANGLNETIVSLEVPNSTLIINGKNMHVTKLLVAEGIVEVDGEIDAIRYATSKPKTNLFKRIFK